MKAVGQGFGLPLDSFAIAVDPDRPPRMLRTPPQLPGCQHWSVWDLSDPLAQLAPSPGSNPSSSASLPKAALVAATPAIAPRLHLVSAPALTGLLDLVAQFA